VSALPEVSRRTFLTSVSLASGGLWLGFRVPVRAASAASAGVFAPNAFIRIDRASVVTLVLPYVEMGQGGYTAQAQLVSEELELDITQLKLEHAPADEKLYSHPVFADQITGGSAGLRGAWETLRGAAASARTLLIAAAAQRWKVSADSCVARRGEVVHVASRRSLRFGELIEAAAKIPPPETVTLKEPAQFRVIGKAVKRVDTPEKVNGRARFGIDAIPEGTQFAVVNASPVFGGKLRSVDESEARKIRSFRQTVKLDDAVAVVADHTWAARKALAALRIDWNEGANADFNTAQAVAEMEAALDRKGVVTANEGDFDAANTRAAHRYEAVFRLPMLAHLAMEPLNCTVHFHDGICEIWTGCQRLAMARRMAAEASGLPVEKVVVHNHLLGGGFGRRLEADYVAQAVRIGAQVKGPVKVIWTREEDVQHDYFRYHNHSRVRVALDADHKPTAFFHRLAGPAVMARWLPVFFKDGIDYDVISVAAGAYEWPSRRIEYVRREPPPGLMVGNWRGVGASRNAFIVESVIDDLAKLAGQDPLQYRRALLAKNPRALHAMDVAARAAGWGAAMPPGRGRGFCLLEDFNSYLAMVAEVTVTTTGQVRVNRVICAVDCGIAVNPDIVKAQIEGGIIYGLSAALYGRITIEKGRIVEGNFDDCPVVRMDEAPDIEVHLIPSAAAPGGVGEPGTAAVFPAVTNAIFAATGKRIFELPIDTSKLRST
jgi:isoquinoline 1-oxidoreductase subunit beta